MQQHFVFRGRAVRGQGRGKRVNVPTINLHTDDVPEGMQDGVYASWAFLDGAWHKAVMHVGPRPVFHDSRSCEVHLLDHTETVSVPSLLVHTIAYLLPVSAFPHVHDLLRQIEADIRQARAMLHANDLPATPQELHPQ